jgi:Flp pilus assembly protein TadD
LRRIAILGPLALALAGCASPEAARDHEKAGLTAMQQGRGEEGAKELETAIDLDPGLYESAIMLAMYEEQRGDAGRAVEILERLGREQPKLALGHMALADLYARLGLYDKALFEYARVSQIAQHPPALLGMAAIYLRRGEPALAERAILAALELEPGDPAARYALAKLYDARHAEIPARMAWERYLALTIGNPREGARLDEARGRLRVLAARLSPEEKAAALAAARALLAPSGAGRAPDADGAPPPDPNVPGVDALRRYFAGRVHLTVYAAHAPAVRGAGRGATILEAVAAAALDAKRSRLFDLQYAGDLGRTRIALDLEADDPAPLTLTEGKGGAPVAAEGFRPGVDGLEVKRGERSAFVLPSDATSLGLATLGDAIGAAAGELGLDRGAWRGIEARKLRTVSFVEAEDATPRPLDLEAGLLPRPTATAEEALAAARAAGLWVASTLDGAGLFAEGYDVVQDRYLPGVTGTAVQLEAVIALADLGQKLGENRLEDAARAAYRASITEAAPRGLALRAALRVDPRRAAAPDLIAGAIAAEDALALAEASLASPGLREQALRLAGRDLRALALVLEGGGPPELEAAAKALAARALEEAKARPEDDVDALEALAAASRLPKALEPEGLADALARAVQATERLAIDEAASYPFRERSRVLGGIRAGPFAPSIATRDVLRRASALLLAAAALDRKTVRAPAR